MNESVNYSEGDFFRMSTADIFFAEIASIATIPSTANIVRKPGKYSICAGQAGRQQVQIFGELELSLLCDKSSI